MRFDVPFHTQESEYDCGPVNVYTTAEYLDKDTNIDEVKKILNYEEGEAIYTIELAIAASKLGLSAEFYTNDPFAEHDGEFYEEHSREIENEVLYQRAEEADVLTESRELNFKEITGYLTENSIPILLIDWNVIKNREGYQGHFVPIVGYNDDKIIIHEPSDPEGDFMEIDREKFNEARKAEGTDQDIAVIKKQES